MNNILILSYNEGNTFFNKSDCDELLNKILLNDPSIIVVCTQESSIYNNNLKNYVLSCSDPKELGSRVDIRVVGNRILFDVA